MGWTRCSRCRRFKEFRDGLCSKCISEDAQRKAREIVKFGVCPKCSAPLKRNSALTGWWQCEQFGADGFRKDSSKPSCDFQIFTE